MGKGNTSESLCLETSALHINWCLSPVSSGVKIDIEESLDVTEAKALGHEQESVDVYSNSWGPKDNGLTVEGPGPLVSRVLQMGAETVRERGGGGEGKGEPS